MAGVLFRCLTFAVIYAIGSAGKLHAPQKQPPEQSSNLGGCCWVSFGVGGWRWVPLVPLCGWVACGAGWVPLGGMGAGQSMLARCGAGFYGVFLHVAWWLGAGGKNNLIFLGVT